MPNSAPIPLEAIPGPNGCPAAHLLSSEREAFAAASKESVAALWLLVELGELGLRHSERDGDDDVADIFQRVVDAAQWGLGHKKAVTNPDDLASLSDDASAGKPSAPSSPGKPS